jgi:hypothetical protein
MTETDLRDLHAAGIIDDAKLAEISAFLSGREKPSSDAALQPRFDLIHLLWYAGALIVIGAMGIFTTDAFNRMGGSALTAFGVIYAVVLTALGDFLWSKRKLRVPGGLLITAAISMVPMIVYGIQDALDLWKYALGDPGQYKNFYPYINGSWIYMEAATILAALIAIIRYRFPFILLMAAVALWFMSMDLAMWFTSSGQDYYDWDTRRMVSIWFGLIMIACAWAWDGVKGRLPDMSFWIHLFGALTFWGALSASDGGTELEKFGYLLINLVLLAFSLFIDRRIYAVAGALGVATYLGYLASSVFQDLIGFSFALSAIGIAIILAGIWLHKNRTRISANLSETLPEALRRLRPADIA